MFHTFFRWLQSTSTRGKHKDTHRHLKWSSLHWWKQEMEPQMTSQISFSLGVLQEWLATPPPALQPINTRNQAITLFFFPLTHRPLFFLNKKSVHNRYVIIFHLLALFNTLITISPAWAERKLLPPLNMNLFYFRWGVRTSLNSCEGKCPCLFSIPPLKSVWLLSLLVLKSWGIIAWWSLYRFPLCCAL